jgi:hypothetical protein
MISQNSMGLGKLRSDVPSDTTQGCFCPSHWKSFAMFVSLFQP